MTQTFLGVDLGGTQMRMAAVHNEGQLATPMFSAPTGKAFSASDLRTQLQAMHKQVCAVIGDQPLVAIGFGITGLVKETTLSESDFLPLLNDINIVVLAEETLGYPAKIENDARCFVLAETRFGAGRGARNVVGITLGTGAGGGVIVDGKLLRGARMNAGEIWSIPLRDKWLEHFVSTTGLVQGYQDAGGEVENVDAAKIAELARGGDAAARAAYQSYGADIALLCETIRALLDPEVVVIGGSIAQARDVFGDELLRRVAERGPRISWAELGTAAGLIGAASLHMPIHEKLKMTIHVSAEFKQICDEIIRENKTESDWDEIESCDMFQSESFCGGYEAIEMAFCFSYYDEAKEEFWFQLSLDEVEEIASGKMITLDVRAAG